MRNLCRFFSIFLLKFFTSYFVSYPRRYSEKINFWKNPFKNSGSNFYRNRKRRSRDIFFVRIPKRALGKSVKKNLRWVTASNRVKYYKKSLETALKEITGKKIMKKSTITHAEIPGSILGKNLRRKSRMNSENSERLPRTNTGKSFLREVPRRSYSLKKSLKVL